MASEEGSQWVASTLGFETDKRVCRVCNEACIAFAARILTAQRVAGRAVLEVGSYDTTGTVRPRVVAHGPASYLGVDIVPGPSVDAICNVLALERTYGRDAFDIVISTEMVEHVRDWRGAFDNMKAVLRPGGLLVLTTRSLGFRFHFGPFDFWRYEPDDMRAIAAEMEIVALERDPISPGVFLAARKTTAPATDLGAIELYSMIRRRRMRDVSGWDVRRFVWTNPITIAHRLLPRPVRRRLKRVVRTLTGWEV